MSNMDTKTSQGEAYWDKYGMPRISLGEAIWNLELTLNQNQTRGCHIWISEAGEGKTQSVHAIARKHKRRVVDIRTSQFNLMGAGIPQRANDETGMFKIAVPDYMPKAGERAILLFDELNQGQPHAIAMFFQLLEDRRIYDYKLPDDCIIVGLMNPAAGAYAVSRIEANPALNRRMMKAYVYSTFNDWRKHAETDEFHYSDGQRKPCHPWVLKYLITEPKMLSTPDVRDAGKQFCCPATWQTVSLSLYNLESIGVELTGDKSEWVENRIAMTINPVNAKALMNYIRDNSMKISPIEILTNYKPKGELRTRILKMMKEPGGDYTNLVDNVAAALFFEKLPPVQIVSHLALFWFDMPTEIAQSFYTTLAGHGKLQEENDNYWTEVTKQLKVEPKYKEMNNRLISSIESFKQELGKNKNKSFDPMP